MPWTKIVDGGEMPDVHEDVLVLVAGDNGPLFFKAWRSAEGNWDSRDGLYWNPPTHWKRVEMPGEEASLLQRCLTLLVDMHESPEDMEAMRVLLGRSRAHDCQGEVANVVRFIMHRRDESKATGKEQEG